MHQLTEFSLDPLDMGGIVPPYGEQVQGDKVLMGGLMRGDKDIMGGHLILIDYIINWKYCYCYCCYCYVIDPTLVIQLLLLYYFN